MDLFVRWKLVDSVKKQFEPFAKGFHTVIGGPLLRMFKPEELELLVTGSPKLDFDELRKYTKYADGYTKDSKTVKHFWEVVNQFSLEEKRRLLTFCTGSDRVPIKFSGVELVLIRGGPDSDRLPTAHTCFNYLILPDYATKEKLKERLLTAIKNCEGFGLK